MTENKSFKFIQDIIKNNDVVLFMKGTKGSPMCGFSNTVVAILERLEQDFYDVNIMLDPELREAIKVYSDWPTIPQLYVKKEFIGGCDIVKEIYQNGELVKLLNK